MTGFLNVLCLNDCGDVVWFNMCLFDLMIWELDQHRVRLFRVSRPCVVSVLSTCQHVNMVGGQHEQELAWLWLVRVRMLTDWQQQPATTVKVRCPLLTTAWLHDSAWQCCRWSLNYQLPITASHMMLCQLSPGKLWLSQYYLRLFMKRM